jgi:hypothetical protein
MRHDAEPLDESASPDLRRLAEEVRSTGRPRLLRRDGEALAMIVPVFTRRATRLTKRALSARDLGAFRSAAGSWSDVDVEGFFADVYSPARCPMSARR